MKNEAIATVDDILVPLGTTVRSNGAVPPVQAITVGSNIGYLNLVRNIGDEVHS